MVLLRGNMDATEKTIWKTIFVRFEKTICKTVRCELLPTQTAIGHCDSEERSLRSFTMTRKWRRTPCRFLVYIEWGKCWRLIGGLFGLKQITEEKRLKTYPFESSSRKHTQTQVTLTLCKWACAIRSHAMSRVGPRARVMCKVHTTGLP